MKLFENFKLPDVEALKNTVEAIKDNLTPAEKAKESSKDKSKETVKEEDQKTQESESLPKEETKETETVSPEPVEEDFVSEIEEAESSILRDYAKTNAHEYFADCFVYWIMYNESAKRMERFKQSAPQTYAYFESLTAQMLS